MRHYLLTRFNTGLYNKVQKDKRGKIIAPEQWMAERMGMFLKYTVPSVLNQSDKKFTWLLFMDMKTPQKYLDMVRYCKANVILCQKSITAAKEHLKGSGDLITSRVDNDDALHRDYIKGINEKYWRTRKKGVYTYPSGLCYKPHAQELRFVRHIPNHFIALVENAEKPKTSLDKGHISIVKFYKTHQLEGKHMWVEVIHYSNLANKFRGTKKEMNRLKKELYGFSS